MAALRGEHNIEDDMQQEDMLREPQVADIVVKDKDVKVVYPHTDYIHRSTSLEDYNFFEFLCLLRKVVKKKHGPGDEGNDGAEEDDNNNNDDDNDAVQEEGIDQGAGGGPLPRQRGRRANTRYDFQSFDGTPDHSVHCHPQQETHTMQLRSLLKVPQLTGKYVPRSPGTSPKRHHNETDSSYDAKIKDYDKKMDDFGSYFVTLMVPWSLETGRPSYSLSWEGFCNWYTEGDRDTNDLHSNRIQYVNHCMQSSRPKNGAHDKAQAIFRDAAADTKETMLANQRGGARAGHCVAGEHHDHHGDGSNDGDDGEAIRKVIGDLRGMMEGVEHLLPVNEGDLQRASVVADLCASEASVVARAANVSNVCIDTTAKDLKQASTHMQSLTKEQCNAELAAAAAAAAPAAEVQPPPIPLNRRTTRQSVRTEANDNAKAVAIAAIDARLTNLQHRVTKTATNRGLNDDQFAFYTTCKNHQDMLLIWENATVRTRGQKPLLRILLTSDAGTGKTFTINCVVEYFRLTRQRQMLQSNSNETFVDNVLIAAPTGVAAQMFHGGTTIHTLIGVNGTSSRLSDLSRGGVNNDTMRENFTTADLLVVDEISMLSPDLNKLLDERSQEILVSGVSYGQISTVILCGDFKQLPPGVGGRGNNTLMASILRPNTPLEHHLRTFKRVSFHINERADDDPWQVELLNMIKSTTGTVYPLTRALLTTTCTHCESAGNPTDQCRHFHEIKEVDIARDRRWLRGPFMFASHSASDSVILSPMQHFAKQQGKPVFKWRLPPVTNTGPNASIFDAIDEPMANSAIGLWGFFVADMPVRITHNASLNGRVVNGSRGTLKWIRPNNPIALRALLDGNTWVPGDILEIDCPIAIGVNVIDSVPSLANNVTFISKDHHHQRRSISVPLVKLTAQSRVIKVSVIGPGYVSDSSGTSYSYQGQTVDLGIADFNKHKSVPLTLSHVYCVLSRVKKALNFRIFPLLTGMGSIDHLLNLRFSDDYLKWNESYDSQGVFQESLIKSIAQLIPAADRNRDFSVRIQRPKRSTTTATTNTRPGAVPINAGSSVPAGLSSAAIPPAP